MSPAPSKTSASALQAELNRRVEDALREHEDRLRALEEEIRLEKVREDGAVTVRALEGRRLEERLGALEAWRREEALTRSGVAWSWLRGLALAAPGIAGLALAVLKGC